MSLVEQELPTLPEHMSSPPGFSGVRVTRSLVLYVCFVDRCLSFCTFSFGHCVLCSSIYGFWLLLWYLQTLLRAIYNWHRRHIRGLYVWVGKYVHNLNIVSHTTGICHHYITSVFHWNVTIWLVIKLKPELARASMTTSDVNN